MDIHRKSIEERFNAPKPQLQKLKVGQNKVLLDAWVGLVFATHKALSETHYRALGALRGHPWLPSSGLASASLPSHVLLDPEALDVCRQSGFDLRLVQTKNSSVRAEAVSRDAPPETHRHLDAHEVPPLTYPEINKLLPAIVKNLHVNAFAYVVEEASDPLVLAFSGCSPLGEKFVNQWVEDCLYENAPYRRHRFLELMMPLDVDWKGLMEGVRMRPGFDRSPLLQKSVWELGESVARLTAGRLEEVWPSPAPPVSTRKPRL